MDASEPVDSATQPPPWHRERPTPKIVADRVFEGAGEDENEADG
jgi:hypothetical protein